MLKISSPEPKFKGKVQIRVVLKSVKKVSNITLENGLFEKEKI